MNFDESAIRAAVFPVLVERLGAIVPAAIASASTRTTGQYVGELTLYDLKLAAIIG